MNKKIIIWILAFTLILCMIIAVLLVLNSKDTRKKCDECDYTLRGIHNTCCSNTIILNDEDITEIYDQ